MKISQVMLSRGLGGAERLFIDLCVGLAARGHEVQAICHGAFQGVGELRHPRIEVSRITARGWWDALARVRIGRALARFGPQVAHAHLGRAARLTGNVARRAGLPVLVTVHNYQDLKYYQAIDHFVVTTEDQRIHLARGGISANRITAIPNFSTLAPQPRHWGEAPAQTTFAAYGRMVAKKGFDVLLRALGRLAGQGMEARLVLGGDGPERARLEALAENLGLGDRVRFAGWISDVPALLHGADVFVLPSLDEPFGIVVLEAMALDTPIVATRSQGPAEILDADTAYLCGIGDPEGLAAAMAEAAADYPGRRRRAAAALERYRSRYSAAVVIPQYEAVYEALSGVEGSPGA